MLEKLNDKGMEGRKSHGLVVAKVLEVTTLKLHGRVHWSPGEKWNKLRVAWKRKWFISLGCVGMRGKESLLVGTIARNINLEDHYTCFGSECLCIHV
jgi:hypothetical protein